jgi:hypothetical protein
MSKPIKLNLPPELEARGRELAGNRRLATVIVEALREQWFPTVVAEANYGSQKPSPVRDGGGFEEWPVVGSIPSEQKRDA